MKEKTYTCHKCWSACEKYHCENCHKNLKQIASKVSKRINNGVFKIKGQVEPYTIKHREIKKYNCVICWKESWPMYIEITVDENDIPCKSCYDTRFKKKKIERLQSEIKERKYTDDTIVNKVVTEILKRSEIGKKKYWTTLDRNDLWLRERLQHLKEELMDAVNYIEKCLFMLK